MGLKRGSRFLTVHVLLELRHLQISTFVVDQFRVVGWVDLTELGCPHQFLFSALRRPHLLHFTLFSQFDLEMSKVSKFFMKKTISFHLNLLFTCSWAADCCWKIFLLMSDDDFRLVMARLISRFSCSLFFIFKILDVDGDKSTAPISSSISSCKFCNPTMMKYILINSSNYTWFTTIITIIFLWLFFVLEILQGTGDNFVAPSWSMKYCNSQNKT